MIEPSDEQLHAADGSEHWQESFYFNWADPEGRDFGLSRIGVSGGRASAGLVTMRDGRFETVYASRSGPYRAHGGGIESGRVGYELLEPLRSWRLRLAGRREVELTWEAISPPYEFPSFDDRGHSFAQHHFEQVGRVEGHITAGGERRPFTGTGHRDKSWGPRDWGGIPGWEWIVGQFEGGFAFNATLMHGLDRSQPAGFVWRDGELCGLADVHCEFTWGRREHVPSAVRLSLTDERGRSYEIGGTEIGQGSAISHGLFLQETHTRWSAQFGGQRLNGVGVTEHAWHAGRADVLRRLPDLMPLFGAFLRSAM